MIAGGDAEPLQREDEQEEQHTGHRHALEQSGDGAEVDQQERQQVPAGPEANAALTDDRSLSPPMSLMHAGRTTTFSRRL
jgi:hypothetical protein